MVFEWLFAGGLESWDGLKRWVESAEWGVCCGCLC